MKQYTITNINGHTLPKPLVIEAKSKKDLELKFWAHVTTSATPVITQGHPAKAEDFTYEFISDGLMLISL